MTQNVSLAQALVEVTRLSFRVAPRTTSLTLLMGTAAGATAAPGAWAMQRLVDTLARPGATDGEVAMLVAVFSVAATATAVSSYLAGLATTRTKATLRLHCEVSLAESASSRAGLDEFEDHQQLDGLHRARRGARDAPPLASDVLIEMLSSLTTLATFAIALFIAWPWILTAVFATALPAALIQWQMMRRAVRVAEESTPEFRWADYYADLQVNIPTARELRAYQATDPCVQRLRGHLDAALKREVGHATTTALVQAGFSVLSGLVLLIGTTIVALSVAAGSASVGDLVLFTLAISAVQRAVFSVMNTCATAAPALAMFAAYSEYVTGEDSARDGFGTAKPLTDAITFEGVWFTYPSNAHPTLRGLNLSFPATGLHAIVGPNGAGKSTVLHLLMRLYQPQRGRILWDGRDIREYTIQSLRRQLTAVIQGAPRLEMTVRDVIALDHLNQTGDVSRLVAAAQKARADQFIQALPDGYNTMLSSGRQHGTSLSGGQWQRLGIARAAFRAHTSVLLFDEPETGLDPVTAEAVRDATFRKDDGRTRIVVSHHLANLKAADTITVIDGGAAIESGTHSELLAARGRYAEMFTRQASRQCAPSEVLDRRATPVLHP